MPGTARRLWSTALRAWRQRPAARAAEAREGVCARARRTARQAREQGAQPSRRER